MFVVTHSNNAAILALLLSPPLNNPLIKEGVCCRVKCCNYLKLNECSITFRKTTFLWKYSNLYFLLDVNAFKTKMFVFKQNVWSGEFVCGGG